MSNTDETIFYEMDDRIERFLRGEMSAEEEASFREELKTNPILCEHARAVSALLKGVQDKGRQHDQNIIDEVSAHKKTYNLRRLIIWTSSIAAAIILVVGVSVFIEKISYEQTDEMLSPYYIHYNVASLSRGETDSVAVAHLYTLFNRIPEENDMADIISELEPIYASLDDDYTYYTYANDIAWNLALAYVKDGKKEKAMAVLNQLISDNEGTPIEEKARILLKEIK